jgi:hypothetical protein
MHLATEPAAVHEHQPLAALGVLIGPERLTDQRRAVVPEGVHQVAQHVGMAAKRILPARLGRLAVAEQVGGDDREALAQHRRDVRPRSRAAGHAMDEQQDGTGPGRVIRHVVPVDRHVQQGHPYAIARAIPKAAAA